MEFQDLSRQVRLEKLVPLLKILQMNRRHTFFCEENRFEILSISDFPVGGVGGTSKAAEQQQPRIFDQAPSTCAGMKCPRLG